MSVREVCIAGKCNNLITLKNDNIELTLLDLGAAVYSLKTQDKHGKFENIVLQYQDITEYYHNPSYFGATVGRVAGRIKDAKIVLDGKTYYLEKNYQDKHTLHGGFNCITHQKFAFELIDTSKVKFTATQRSITDKFPADVTISVTYELLENAIVIYFNAVATADTILNMTNHCYYNLSGDYKTTIVNHQLEVPATQFVNVDVNLIPTDIQNLPQEMDFRQKSCIGDKLKHHDSKYFRKGGIDHCYIVDGMVKLEDSNSGRKLKLSSSYPAMQIYTCNVSRGHTLSNGKILKQYGAICFEPQYIGAFDGNYDNHPAKLRKGQEYQHFIKLEF
ncbi:MULTISPECIES: aldose epimerase family protein [Francisella]|uniref:Galactose mutarotase n=1 Tax=Francisella opportunistica TaxID=2016517 RepID=A0A345JRV7_9GAMM|nr:MULTISPECIES: aldose epimerase family protein [Francisella]APC91805.1 Aldose 1-epimerase [Francisella sp. MA067296]AXH30053.1 galactose mutarotase [Francisella opportunistica]AXH31697.1 galactose mutarotase [Francisella opportunistica]AXH33343.1 galactose mutarotase [Francisella opportunistica]